MVAKETQATKGLGRKGTRASMACINCRQRKIKCDVQSKAQGARCTQCQNSQIPCAIEPSGDRRKARVGNTSEHLSALHGRMQALEDLLLKERARNEHFSKTQQRGDRSESQETQTSARPQAVTTTNAAHDQADCSNDLPIGTGADMIELHRIDNMPASLSDTRRLPTPHTPGFSKHNKESQEMFDMGDYSTENCSPGRAQLLHPNANTHMENMNTGAQLDSQHQQPTDVSVVHDLVEGASQPDIMNVMPPSLTGMKDATEIDEGRFYGPTSQPYLQSVHEESPLSAADELETEMSLDVDSTQVRRLLFQNYWDMHALAAKVVVDKQRFMSDRAIGKRSQYYSTFLESALLACATRTSTSSSMRELGQQYLERAKSEMLLELEHLNIASVQGFLLLSDFEATRGRDRLGWMYCGIACRSLFDLGLHESSPHPGKASWHGSMDVTSRHLFFLTSFVYDQLWSLYLGRPTSISLDYLRAARRAAKEVPVPEELDAWVSLCVQIAKVTAVLNSSTWTDAKAYDRRLSELSEELDACFENLPSRLRYEEGGGLELDAGAYGLNIQFCGIKIVLHRVWSRLRHERRSDLEGTGTQRSEDAASGHLVQTQSAWIIHQSAVRVAKLIRTYKRIYGVEKIITIMLDNMYVAATALISHTLSPVGIPASTGISGDKDVQWLRLLSETLNEVQKYYPITTVMISTLSHMVEGTALGGIFRSRRGSTTSKSSSSATIGPLFEGVWGSRDAFMHDFSFDMGSVMDPSFTIEDDRYFQNPIITPPPWGL